MKKADLFERRLATDTVETLAGTITVRALSRAEVLDLGSVVDDKSEWDIRVLLSGVVEPTLTRDEVKRWRAAWPYEALTPVIAGIERLSALDGSPPPDFPARPGHGDGLRARAPALVAEREDDAGGDEQS